MNLYDLDWTGVLRLMPTWDTLRLESKKAIIEMKPGQRVPAARFGPDLERLRATRIVVGDKQGIRFALHPSARVFASALRAMHRLPVLDVPGDELLLTYLSEVFTRRERMDMMGQGYEVPIEVLARHVASAGWLTEFLDGPGSSAGAGAPARLDASRQFGLWEITNDRSGYVSAETAIDVGRRVARELLEVGTPLPLTELVVRVPESDDALVADALRGAIASAIIFPGFRASDLSVVLGLWPPTCRRFLAPDPSPPAEYHDEPGESFSSPLLLEDMTTMLVGASARPIRIRQHDGAIFAKEQKALAADLMRLPEWLSDFEYGDEERLEEARRVLLAMGLLRADWGWRGGMRGSNSLRTKERAMDWLGLPDRERLRTLLDALRGDQPSEPTDEDDDPFIAVYPGTVDFLPQDYRVSVRFGAEERVRAAVVSAFGGLSDEGSVDVEAFHEYHARSMDNPLLDPTLFSRDQWRYHALTVEDREEIWHDFLLSFLERRLIPVGGVRLEIGHDGSARFGITRIGRYLLGLADDFEYGGPAADQRPVVVQPNFDVVFLSPAPRLEAAIARFAERLATGLGTLFRITRGSIYDAAGAGLSAEQVLETLMNASNQPLPDNVEREITGWFERRRRVSARKAWIIHCPDEETATRILGAAGAKVRALSPAVLEVLDDDLKPALVHKLSRCGVFVDW